MSQSHQAFWLEVWRKASVENFLEIQFSNLKAAHNARMALYRAIKPFRENPFRDPKLFEISEKLSANVDKPSLILRIAEKFSDTLIPDIADQLGIDLQFLSPIRTEDEQELEDSASDLLRRIDSSEIKLEKKNPFFNRDSE